MGPVYINKSKHLPTHKWARGITGPASLAYPSPNEWSFDGSTKPLDKVTTKDLTTIFMEKRRKPPTCIARWEKLLAEEQNSNPHKLTTGPYPVGFGNPRINVAEIGNHYNTAFLHSKIYNIQFKFILHGKFLPTWKIQALGMETFNIIGCRFGCGFGFGCGFRCAFGAGGTSFH